MTCLKIDDDHDMLWVDDDAHAMHMIDATITLGCYNWVKYWSLVHIRTQCHDKIVKSKCYNIQVQIFKLWWFIGLFDGLHIMSWSLQKLDDHKLTKVYLCWSHSFGCIWVDWIGYICNVACYKMIEWIEWLVIKFGLIWVG